MTNPLISVIITCFNQEKQIIKTLQSVLSQTYKEWECIIIDDGSTDNSEGAIRRPCQRSILREWSQNNK